MISDFPNSLSLAHQFELQMGHICCILHLFCPEDILISRLSISEQPEKHFSNKSLEERIAEFGESVKEILAYYEGFNKVYRVDATRG